MSNIMAYNAQGEQVSNNATLYRSNNQNSVKGNAPNTMPVALPLETPVGRPSMRPAQVGVVEQGQRQQWIDPNMYGPQKNLQAQIQQRYMQIKSEPQPTNFIAYSGAINNYASY